MKDGTFADVYVLVDNRDISLIKKFLEHFMPKHWEMADEYEVPRYSKRPTSIFKKANELMEYCENNPTVHHAIYWSNNVKNNPRSAMIFYTNDAKMILGLAIDDEGDEQEWLQSLKIFFKSNKGCILYESPPPENSKEFLKLIN